MQIKSTTDLGEEGMEVTGVLSKEEVQLYLEIGMKYLMTTAMQMMADQGNDEEEFEQYLYNPEDEDNKGGLH